MNAKEKRTQPNAMLANIREHAETLAKYAKELEDQLAKSARTVKATREIAVKQIPGDPGRPFFVGNDCTTPELSRAVERCISDRPHTLREIVELTGCTNRNRISGVIVKLSVAGKNVKNIGQARRALWWIPSQRRAR